MVGFWVFAGSIGESVPPVRVAAAGSVMSWAARFAAACRCPQEVRAFGDDPES
ncbi:hypothetical protein [Clavibacter sp. Sh2088]|uniref:hypothetical protein n=1 Tax=Clavibacter sp. Sh2088 TaxID=3397676 RepID=UPI0039DF842E